MRAPRIHSVQSMVFVTTYLEIIQRLESMRVSTTTVHVHVMEVSYDLSSEMRIMFSLLTLWLITMPRKTTQGNKTHLAQSRQYIHVPNYYRLPSTACSEPG